MINSFSHKTQKIRIVPINAEVRRILEFWKLGRKNEYVFYNRKTGERFVEVGAGLQEGRDRRSDVAHVATHFRLTPFGTRCGHYHG